MIRPVVYVAHALNAPTRAEIDANRARASRWVAWVGDHGCAPVADWIILSGIWTEDRRLEGLEIDCALIERCDAVILVGGRVSDGMRKEADHADHCGAEVIDLTELGEEPPQFDFDLLARVTEATDG